MTAPAGWRPNLSLEDAAAVWGVSRRTAYRLAEAGLVRVARFGRRVTVPAVEVERVSLEGVKEAPQAPPNASAVAFLAPRRGRPRRKVDDGRGVRDHSV